MNSINTGKVLIRIIEPGILENYVLEGKNLEVEDMVEVKKANISLSQGSPYVIFVHAAPFSNISGDARKFIASPEFQQITLAKAILVNSLAQKLVSNFYLKFNKPSIPTRVFSDRDEAMKWLREKLKSKLNINSR